MARNRGIDIASEEANKITAFAITYTSLILKNKITYSY